MLIDGINEQLADPRMDIVPGGPMGGARGFDGLRATQQRLSGAALFDLEREVVAMCVNVSFGRPSSILAALSHIKLPAESTWIEFANTDVKAAMTEAGSTNTRIDTPIMVDFERTGFLIRREGSRFLVEMVTRQRTPAGRRVTNVASVLAYVAIDGDTTAPFTIYDKVEGATGLVAKHFKTIETDPKENGAHQALFARYDFARHPEMAPFIRLMEFQGVREVESQLSREAADVHRLFAAVALPALILLSCRNAVERETVLAPEKLNKARIKAGKAPIRERHVVRMSLSKRKLFKAAAARDGGRAVRASLVIGHFKVRQSGVFWWSPHARGGWGTPAQVVRKVAP